uniref:V-type proton ATPase subunit E n=1 Tax=Rhizophora mucronata TaxID=61149 RepID=A0A2P2J2K0_RHIMU
MVISTYAQKLLGCCLHHRIHHIILGLKNFDPRSIKLHGVLNLLSNIELLLFLLILLPDLLLLHL